MEKLTIGGNTKRSRFKPILIEVPAFADMPQASKDFVVAYGLRQYLADGMAGAESQSDAEDGVKARVANILAGEFKRAKGEGLAKPDTEEQRAIKLARAFIRDQLKAQEKTAEKDVVNAAATKLLASTDGAAGGIAKKLKAEAKKQVAQEAATREALAEGDNADLLADLLAADETPDGDEPDDETE